MTLALFAGLRGEEGSEVTKISAVGSRENFVNREKGDRVGKDDEFRAV